MVRSHRPLCIVPSVLQSKGPELAVVLSLGITLIQVALITSSSFKGILKKMSCRIFLVPDCNNLSKVQFKVVNLSNENGSQSLIEGGPIHVDGGPYREHESGNAFVHAIVLFQALEGDG